MPRSQGLPPSATAEANPAGSCRLRGPAPPHSVQLDGSGTLPTTLLVPLPSSSHNQDRAQPLPQLRRAHRRQRASALRACYRFSGKQSLSLDQRACAAQSTRYGFLLNRPALTARRVAYHAHSVPFDYTASCHGGPFSRCRLAANSFSHRRPIAALFAVEEIQ